MTTDWKKDLDVVYKAVTSEKTTTEKVKTKPPLVNKILKELQQIKKQCFDAKKNID